ncbi:Arc family DNA-binding protein [Streptomyces sp. SD15]
MVKFTLRIPDNLHNRMTAQAATDRRSLNSEILYLLEVGLANVTPDAESPGGYSATPAPLRGSGHSPRP